MSLKIHLLHSHLNFFPERPVDFSDEHGERFHQDISKIETRYNGKSILKMLSDYCWGLTTASQTVHKRKASRISFQNAEKLKKQKEA